MNKINYDAQMQNLIATFGETKPKLLLHACCAPCASACVERLKDSFSITLFFYNPNIDSLLEYQKRAEEIEKLAGHFNVDCIVKDYDDKLFYSAVSGLENQVEGGSRCTKCFTLRLEKTAEYCLKNEYDYFATTLTVSPLKNSDLINSIGQSIGKQNKVKYLASDFKKRNGYLRSIELSKQLGLYRQNYCGCKFSKNEKL